MRRLVATLSGLALVLSGTGAAARKLPNYDALQDAKPAGRVSAGFKSVDNPGVRVAHQDERTHSPTFIWVNKVGGQTKLAAKYARMAPEQAAQVQLADHAPLYGLSSFESAGARVVSVSQGSRGTKVVTIGQEAAGLEVFRQSLKLLLNRNNEVVAISGTLSKHVSSDVPAARVRFQVPAADAVSIAYKDLTGHALDGSLLSQLNTKQQDGGQYTHYSLASYARPLEQDLVIPARVKQVLYSLPNALVPAYYVELNTGSPESKESDYYAYVVSAVDGRLLMRNNLTADADYSYRVFADPTPPYTPHDGPAGNNATPHPTAVVEDAYRPPFVAPALVTLQNAPFSQNDPWLPDGATVTTGNNVDAYADLVAPDNYQAGDLRPTITAPGVFDRTMLFDIQPNANAEQIAAATTSLFFVNNWLHDWYYDSGFDEASGNAQSNNFGRGGLGNDAIRAQAQDYGGTNNANMQTPADGASPIMQMYLFSGPRNSRLTVNAPAPVAGDYRAGIAAAFGPQTFDISGDVVLGLDDSNATGPSTGDACTPLTNAAEVAGKIAFVDRGSCNFTAKMQNVQAAGAIGVIVADNLPGYLTDLGGTVDGITIPALRLTLDDANRLRGSIPGLNVRMFRGLTTNVDGTVDNVIVAHEWGHYISNRLIGNSNGLANNQGRSMGEGWGDFTALLMVTRPEDINVPSNANWTGAYGAAEYATRGISPDSAFFGIRRVTYSADMSKNALTFHHIQDGVALPNTAPIAPGGLNSEVHNSGEVWATMLWECYVALLRAHPFQEAQDRMKSYLVNGYKLTPVLPTFLEARDAVLAAAYANDPADGLRLWAAFARRGAGVGAVAPDRYSIDHAGVVESFALGTNVEFVNSSFADSATTPGDSDGILDNGETGEVRITVRNNGSEPARGTSVTVFSSTPGVTVGNRGSVVFPEIPIGGMATASVPVSLNGASTAQRVDFNFALRDDGQAVPGDKTDSLAFKANYDELPAATATESVEARVLPWGNDFDPALTPGGFGIVEFADLNRTFYGPNFGAPSDIRLITPPLNVSATNPLVLSFRHAYDFEADVTGAYDGAVIELSNDGGATWVDIGAPLYNGRLVTYSGNFNPLKGRNAIVGSSANFPEFVFATLNLGTTYAGQTVQIRFRIGSDNAAAFTGWVLDDLSFSGITNTPFTKICDDSGICVNTPPTVSAGPDMTANERMTVSLNGSAVDMDGDALTYAWAQVSGPVVTLSGDNTLTPSFTAPDVSIASNVVLRLSVSDGTSTVSDTVSVNVRNANRVPTVNAGVDGSADERTTYTLSGSASDADGDTLSYLWTQVSGTPVALRDYDKATATFVTPEIAFDEMLTFTLTVSDGNESISDTVDVVVRQVNRAPMVTASSVTVDERSTATLQATASDADGDSLTYAWTQLSGTPVVLSGANTATATFSAGEVSADSVLTFRVTVSDGQASASHDVVVDVRNVNVAPTVNAGLDGTVNERASYTLSGSASDADGDTLSYSWVQVSGTPVGLSGANSASATFTAPETASGETLTFVLTVSDGKASASDTVNVVVNNVNRAPVVTASSVTVDERSTATLQATGSDVDGDALTYAWTQLSGTPVVLSGANTATASFSTGEVSADSMLTFRVTVSDGQATASHDVTVTVRQVNAAPTVNAGVDGSVNERTSYTLSGSASDADGDTLSYSWVQVSGTPVALSGANSASATFTAPETASGETLSFTLTVSDGKLSASDTVNVVVNNVNRAPVVTASSVTVDERSTATLQAAGSDADGDSLTYAWTQLTGTPVTLSGADTATATFSTGEVSADEVLTFRVTVSDGQATASHDVVVDVRNVNVAPTVNAGLDGTVDERGFYMLSGSASDADGDTLSYTWVQVSGTPVALSGATSSFAFFDAPETVSGETLTFMLTVSDGKASASDTVDVVVNNVNLAPVVVAPDLWVSERSTATLDAFGVDPDGDPLTYTWTQLTGTPVVLSGADTAIATFSTGEVSADTVLTFRVTVSDGHLSASQDVSVLVRQVNVAPTVNAGLDGSVNERTSYTLAGSASDADGDTLSYAWVQVSGTPVALAGANTAQATFTAPETASGETLTFVLTVSDGKASASDTVNVVVNNVNRAPVVMASSVTVDERSTATLHATASDADGDGLTYAWTQQSGTPVVLSGADTATVTFSTGEVNADSVFTFRVMVFDGHVSASQDVTVTVRNINAAPTVDAGQDGSVNERASYTLAGSASDVDGDALSYLWVQVSGTPVGLSGANTAQATFIAPETASSETLTFTLTVSDGKLTANDTVNVVVNNVNRAPVVTASPVTVDERSTATLHATASDPEGDALTYAWTQVSGTPVTLSGADSATATFATGEVTADRTYSFRVSVSDGQATTTRDVVVTVRNINPGPVANAGSAVSVVARAAASLDGSASAGTGTLTYQWTQVGGPWVTLVGADTATPSFTAPDVKTATELVFSLVVSDGTHTSVPSTVTVTVSPADNTAPVAKARIILSGSQASMTLDGSASSDADGEALTYKWEQTAGAAMQLDNATQAVLSVDVPASGTYSFRLTVTDARGVSHSTTVEATATLSTSTPDEGGCSATGSGAPASVLGLALLGLLRRRRWLN
ncbi:myxosortase-dependent M36 family metallopeptidase [Archangium lansingense]|uniref:myxosortase-dependent M36 family metallopeptidase n=1 Tax=Archangium lansingense TaxID=2995310 RepID=UPI00280A7E5B|nr:myxosortase-dependent M36 family metallopeptidase [Archangium lansinium]